MNCGDCAPRRSPPHLANISSKPYITWLMLKLKHTPAPPSTFSYSSSSFFSAPVFFMSAENFIFFENNINVDLQIFQYINTINKNDFRCWIFELFASVGCVFCVCFGAAAATEHTHTVRRAMKMCRRSHLIAVDLLFFKCYDYDYYYYFLSSTISIAVDAWDWIRLNYFCMICVQACCQIHPPLFRASTCTFVNNLLEGWIISRFSFSLRVQSRQVDLLSHCHSSVSNPLRNLCIISILLINTPS